MDLGIENLRVGMVVCVGVRRMEISWLRSKM